MRRSVMVRLGPVLVAFSLTGCLAGKIGGGDDPETHRGDLRGRAFSNLCQGLAGATVSTADGSASARTDAAGEFALVDVALPATLVVTGPGIVPTRSPALDTAEPVEVYGVPAAMESLAYLLAGETRDPDLGVVAAAFVNEAQIPIANAVFSLTDAGGRQIALPLYLTIDNIPLFDTRAVATTSGSGVALFFAVPPGRYELAVEHDDYLVAPQTVDVGAGSPTLVRFVGSGDADTVAPRVTGTVRAKPLVPAIGAAQAVAGVTVSLDDGSEATTAADGSFTFELSRMRFETDLTFSAADYPTQRSARFCVGTRFNFDSTLEDVFWVEQEQRQAGSAPDPLTGHVRIGLMAEATGSTYAAGVRIDVSPAANVYYGRTEQQALDPCNVGSCAGPGDCPGGARCEDGVCLVGDAPSCVACGEGDGAWECPAGTAPAALTADGVWGPCFCAAVVDDCAASACPSHTRCEQLVNYTAGEDGSTSISLAEPVCFPHFRDAPLSIDGPAIITGLQPGIYTFTTDGGERDPLLFRVEAGVVASGRWRPRGAF